MEFRIKMAQKLTEKEAITLLYHLGKRRQAHQEEGERLAQEIREALVSTERVISRTNAANLLGVDRTLLYKTYMKEESMNSQKKWLATYIDPVTGVDANDGDKRLRRHLKGCRFLQPDSHRPHVGRRRASNHEMTTQPECKVCG